MTDIHEIERTRHSVQKHWYKMLFTFGTLTPHVAVCGIRWRDWLVLGLLVRAVHRVDDRRYRECRYTVLKTSRQTSRRDTVNRQHCHSRGVGLLCGLKTGSLQLVKTTSREMLHLNFRSNDLVNNPKTLSKFLICKS